MHSTCKCTSCTTVLFSHMVRGPRTRFASNHIALPTNPTTRSHFRSHHLIVAVAARYSGWNGDEFRMTSSITKYTVTITTITTSDTLQKIRHRYQLGFDIWQLQVQSSHNLCAPSKDSHHSERSHLARLKIRRTHSAAH